MATLSELYKRGEVKEDQIGMLARAVLCEKLGCSAGGQEVAFGVHKLRLAESLPSPRAGQVARQAQASRADGARGAPQQSRPLEGRGATKAGGVAQSAPKAGRDPRDVRQSAQAARREAPLQPQKPAVNPATGQRPPVVQRGEGQRQGAPAGARPAGGQATAQRGHVSGRQAGPRAQPLFPPEQGAQPLARQRPAGQRAQAGAQRPPAHEGQPAPKEPQQGREPSAPQGQSKPGAPGGGARLEGKPAAADLPALGELAKAVAREAKADVAAASAVLSSIMDYLAVYPSVGILRLIDDIAKKTKADPRLIRVAIDALRGVDAIEVVDGAVVNLKKR